ncbi:MAG: hypothetical protein QOG25_2148, partial [Acetobacteraceae bacterium]|nr:hypothetical protein [Acetobacteraceae bacterium]
QGPSPWNQTGGGCTNGLDLPPPIALVATLKG